MMMSLIMYIILYYRFRDIRIYKKYIFPRLFENFSSTLQFNFMHNDIH